VVLMIKVLWDMMTCLVLNKYKQSILLTNQHGIIPQIT
jgi:hypothetical protein